MSGRSSTRVPEPEAGRHETELERADRNLGELLQELRVLVTGVQVLFAFLLTVPFATGFKRVSAGERYLYLAILIAAAAAAGLLIAPTAMHRILFRQGDKRWLVQMSSRLAIAGIACLAIAMSGIVGLISGHLFGWATGLIVGGLVGVYLVTLWFVLGIRRRIKVRAQPGPPGAPTSS